MASITIGRENCKSCGYCVRFCPAGVLVAGEQVNSKGYEYVISAHIRAVYRLWHMCQNVSGCGN